MLPKRTKKQTSSLSPAQYAQSVAILAAFASFMLIFVAAEMILSLRPHPYHWGTALIGGGVIALVVYLVAYRQRVGTL